MSIDKLQNIFREVFENEDIVIRPEMNASNVENWDSFNHINLVVSLEDAFDVTFQTDEIAGMANVGDLVKSLQKKGISIDWNEE